MLCLISHSRDLGRGRGIFCWWLVANVRGEGEVS